MFDGATVQQLTINGSTYDVRLAGRQAQAVRVDKDLMLGKGATMARAAVAMEMVSGCIVRNVYSDGIITTAGLKCRDMAKLVRPEPLQRASYRCLPLPNWVEGQLKLAPYRCDLAGH
ncbi:hypothetical protein [Chachezhania sediminis]|uniref:hypothetical protein n=1 Tax=Chachezhania sediminis TaxID=2599291 RepID=UPI00131D67AF|nr:hypothetical protein [Chachezhania sediminis]